ncbi:MAG: hypothetical protein M9947_12205 [Thermomicrobiales bacterium]|nr:hypothetical protein [Thermomicrobiales bacterium]
MVTPARDVSKNRKPSSITEVIAAAADVVIARPLVILVPIVLDLWYLLGWKITAGGTFDRLRNSLVDLDTTEGEQLADFMSSAAGADLAGLIAFVIPSFLAGNATEDLYRPITHSVVDLDNWGAVMFAIVILIGVTMVTFGVFGLWLADTTLKRERSWGDRFRLGPVIGGRFVLLILLIVAMVLLLCIPLFFAMLVAAILGIGLEGLVLTVSLLVGLGLYLLFYFAPDSLLVDLAGPVQALRASSEVVRKNLAATVGFALVSLIISIGLADIGDRLSSSAPGLGIAVVANAFVGCALWIASLLFFSERSKLLAPERAGSGSTRSKS